ncbi:uncharacterized protein FOMMEDRAFT_151261 [Fomitiporia mediterranea MF3/22]|uniref:uncharacterized protein n=1 Tax=Fomitiporia mediterranea (strain MF3/22) TaxID=694068 RepID=UPI0004407839|nr:uncharacterized protein FOMMEDRAFT_151261 [Fomitiporia mediterranea MF3/22]EJD08406.1 hypothetical protein FOMMEDRAFT_151261 [Fomitiporia mediterranea MF3/22]
MAQQHEQVLENLDALADMLEQRRAQDEERRTQDEERRTQDEERRTQDEERRTQDEEIAQVLRNVRQQMQTMAQGAGDSNYQASLREARAHNAHVLALLRTSALPYPELHRLPDPPGKGLCATGFPKTLEELLEMNYHLTLRSLAILSGLAHTILYAHVSLTSTKIATLYARTVIDCAHRDITLISTTSPESPTSPTCSALSGTPALFAGKFTNRIRHAAFYVSFTSIARCI